VAFIDVSAPANDDADTATPVVVRCRGENDSATVPELAETMARVILGTASDVVLDLREVEFIDAATMSFIVRADIVLRGSARTLIVESPSAPARRVLDVCGLAYEG
jgi:anti-anti-sigma factor